ncbi:hypothetical protein [Bradyrhizobium sp. Arg816]|uniref:hypothetical protein n=1 Tax=Bradyrhizobium sp. Arg816 TaxID=2998491 RepID=UPI00249DAEC3|nr:hypothetical protein [Bradyrhizobium sp. Arg816]MDI3564780.1 hypothetical protein [Bradyrhizobium sp. Arg816]
MRRASNSVLLRFDRDVLISFGGTFTIVDPGSTPFKARIIPIRAYFLPDGIHLTAAGYALVEAVRKPLEIA